MKKFDFTQPEFLFCEIAIKDDSQNDQRIWIYHRLSLSLIEFVSVNHFKDFQISGVQERFEYNDENWFGVYVQNNSEATDFDQQKVLKNAWQYLLDYLAWEDANIA
jgi:hypothetical protein